MSQARTDKERKGSSGISAFIVEKGTPGLSLGNIDKEMGQKGAHTCAVIFESVCRVADRAVQIFGGAGYLAECGIERFYSDVRLFRIYEGTTQIQQLVIARNLLRDNAT